MRALTLSHAPGGKLVPPIPGLSAQGPFYVALGASESLGIQPRPSHQNDMGDTTHGKYAHTGGPTKVGYANDITAATRSRWPHLRLVQFGCSGITVVAAYEGGSTCHYSDGSQIATTVHFLRNHPSETDLISIDFGYNDIWPCLTDRTVNQQCVNDVMTTLHRDLPHAIADLRAAAGSKTIIVGLKHNNPSLADWLQPEAGRQFANESAGVFQQLNSTLGSIFRAAGMKVADVPPYWGIGSKALANLDGYGLVPADVAEVCEASWVCSEGNIHPNAEGYRKIATAVLAALHTK
jgi:lysophospholipase L1-like esterase